MIILWQHSFNSNPFLVGNPNKGFLPFCTIPHPLFFEAVCMVYNEDADRNEQLGAAETRQEWNCSLSAFYKCIVMLLSPYTSKASFFFNTFLSPEKVFMILHISRKGPLNLMRFYITYLLSKILFYSGSIPPCKNYHCLSQKMPFPSRDDSVPVPTVQTYWSARTEHLSYPSVPEKSNSFILEQEKSGFE